MAKNKDDVEKMFFGPGSSHVKNGLAWAPTIERVKAINQSI